MRVAAFRFVLLLTVVMLFAPMTHAQDARLQRIQSVLAPLREKPNSNPETRGATAAFNDIKRDLISWVESRVSNLRPRGDEKLAATEINRELRNASLLCGQAAAGLPECPEWGSQGFLGDVSLEFKEGGTFLLVKTAIGIDNCGHDWSAYLYEWKSDLWQRIWQTEQNTYTARQYLPQDILAVILSPSDYRDGRRISDNLVLTLGSYEWCTSNWHSVFYRVWNVDSARSTLLLDKREDAFNPRSIEGAAESKAITVEFSTGSIDVGVLSPNCRTFVQFRRQKFEPC